jgi:hypothetical protein
MKSKVLSCITAGLVLAGYSSNAPSSKAGNTLILADIGATRQHLLVTNSNPFVWRKVTFVVNGTYRYRMEVVPRGSTSITLASFVDDDGQPFSGTAAGLRGVDIAVGDAAAGRQGSFRW